ncbi:hypothetical protein ElyMa_005438500 [Elysia marginata]|uniref:Uncharacterized protein n=1 Tax=Elysia marginata TaxID=1093978 RepID=A0AAV4EM56_9GAST|nr:hypothetical protein ElyMa_005438500 [Elysia marginata]
MVTLFNADNITLRDFCSSLILDTADTAVVETQPVSTSTQPPPPLPPSSPLSTAGTYSGSSKAVVVIPYVLVATTLIVVLVIDFTLYRRNNAYKYRRKQERSRHDDNKQFRKIRGSARVPMDPEHLVMSEGTESSPGAAESSSSPAHDQGHVYADDDIGGLSAAVSAENSKVQLQARKARFSDTDNEAERGMAAWQLKFGKSVDNTQARYMNFIGSKKV